MTIGIYIRVSTQEQAQEGYSIAAQRERLTAYCIAQGWEDFKFYVDEGISAKDTNRPQLQSLLENVESGNIKIILVYRLDRFTRKVKDLHRMLEFLETNKCAFKSATEPYDTSTAMGKLFITIVAALAEWETDNMSERIKMALEEKVSKGERVGGIPFGFDLSDEGFLVKNKQSALLLEIINMIRDGMSLNQVTHYLNNTNSDKTTWHINTVYRLLRNPALYGATKWNDKVFEDTHKGIMTKEEFDKLQVILDDRMQNRRREVKSKYLFQGVIECPNCQKKLSVNRHLRKNKDGTEYQIATYRCQSCNKEGKKVVGLGETRILEAVKFYMQGFSIKHVEIQEDNTELEMWKSQYKQIERKREKFQKAWSNDLISDEEFSGLMAETRKIYEELKEKIKKVEPMKKKNPLQLEFIAKEFNNNFFKLNVDEQRKFVSRFIRSIKYHLVPQQPKRKRNSKGKELIVIDQIDFY